VLSCPPDPSRTRHLVPARDEFPDEHEFRDAQFTVPASGDNVVTAGIITRYGTRGNR